MIPYTRVRGVEYGKTGRFYRLNLNTTVAGRHNRPWITARQVATRVAMSGRIFLRYFRGLATPKNPVQNCIGNPLKLRYREDCNLA